MDTMTRAVYRGQLTKLTNSARDYLTSSDSKVCEEKMHDLDNVEEELVSYIERITVARNGLNKVNADIRGNIKPEDTQKELEAILEYEDKAAGILARLKQRLKKLHGLQYDNINSASAGNPSGKATSAKLPKLALKTFSGDFKEWLPFWEIFRSAVHENLDLSGTEKFNYLQSHITGKAADCIGGFTPTDANYAAAISLLLEQYGNNSKLVDYTMQQLMSLPHISSRNDVTGLRKLYNSVTTHTRSLTALGIPTSQYAVMLKAVIIKALPHELVVEFYRVNDSSKDNIADTASELNDKTSSNTQNSLNCVGSEHLHDILHLVRREVESLERSGSNYIKRANVNIHKTATSLFTPTTELSCILCKSSEHRVELCDAPKTLAEKKAILRAEGRCFKCTRRGHSAKFCKNKWIKCSSCKGNHATAVCDPEFQADLKYRSGDQSDAGSSSKLMKTQSLAQPSAILYSPSCQTGSQILLQTARVFVSSTTNRKGSFRLARIVLDGGSQRSYITRRLVEHLNMPIFDTVYMQIMPFGCSQKLPPQSFDRVKVTLTSIHTKTQSISVLAIVVPKICADILPFPDVQSECLSNLQLADDYRFNEHNDYLQMLLGADVYWSVMQEDVTRVTENLVANKTIFGWTVQGPVGNSPDNGTTSSLVNLVVSDYEEIDDLKCIVEKFWSLECLGISPETNESCHLSYFDKYIRWNGWRYETALLWKDANCVLESNYKNAMVRVQKLINKISKFPEQLIEYDDLMWELITSDVAEVCHNDANSKRVYYMPHRSVYRLDKETTKTRIVFDASSKTGFSPSLNDLLITGPNLLPDILKILLNFRMGRIALTADIEKAFLQISLAESDRDVHRFLWFKEKIKNDTPLPAITSYRMKRVTFGVKCSPFALCATLRRHLELQSEVYFETCKKLCDSFYMDDLVLSLDSIDEGICLYKESCKVMQKASMNLRKWRSNNPKLRANFANDICSSQMQKILGVSWYVTSDELAVYLEKILSEIPINVTKRTLLQTLAKIYDPLGVLGPYTIRLKLLFQDTWRKQLEWDEPLPSDLLAEWNRCLTDLPLLQDIPIPRCTFLERKRSRQELHVFADASPKAYGVVAYIRSEYEDSSIGVSYLCSKNRLAPLRNDQTTELTLPKMELTAPLTASRLLNYLMTNLQIEFDSPHLWTDSKIVLFWIRSNKHRKDNYVQNRVHEIRRLAKLDCWKHCPGNLNPADLLTRGETAKSLLKSSSWISGPDWLKELSTNWPAQENYIDEDNFSFCLITFNGSKIQETEPIMKLETFSRYKRLLRVTAYVQRFVCSLRGKKPEREHLTAAELRRAEIYWIKIIQLHAFPNEVEALVKGAPCPRDSKILTLNPMLDEQQLLRVGSRLSESNFDLDEKFPVILCKGSHFTNLLIWDAHETVMHGGVNAVLVKLRRKYWILKGRQAIKAILRRCNVCRRLKGKNASQPFAPLPKERLYSSRPFETIGVDFAGPLYGRNNTTDQSTRKVYIMLVTCAVIRAVHLELIMDLTAGSCISAFRRFFARRGIPKLVFSDNAKTFKRTALELRKVNILIQSENFQNYISHKGINWNFIAERAAWWGGFWERLVKSTKDILKSGIGRSTLTIDQLQTYLAEAEFIINSRPLTYIGDDPLDLSPLTPAHFLIGSFPSMLCLQTFDGPEHELRKTWKGRLRLFNSFVRRFKEEYVQQLRSAHHTQKTFSYDIKAGDVVLVYDASTPRLFWKLALVMNVFPGRDGKIRACELRFSNGTITRRAVQHLYPLEVSSSSSAAGGC